MSVIIERVGPMYAARVTPPHGKAAWSTNEPMARDELVSRLLALGCHQTDIGDAFYEADPEWLLRADQ
jgi:hypothetical protein